MKKSIVFLTAYFISLSCFAQLPKDDVTGKVTYQGVVDVSGVTKDDLFSRTREWLAKYYVSSKAVVEYEDKTAGKIVGRAILGVVFQMNQVRDVRHTITFEFKDGKYKYVITNFILEFNGDYAVEDKMPHWGVKKFYENLDTEAKRLVDNFKTTIAQSKSEW